jgi:hypothetical protein
MSGVESSQHQQREEIAAPTIVENEDVGFTGDEPYFPWWLRLILFAVGATIVGLLLTAVFLKPSPDGFGTHRQLGLPPCTMIRFFGVRCPSCGMTTSWTYLVRGRLIASQQANTGGLLLGLAAMFTGPWLVGTALKGRWFLVIPREAYVVGIGASIVLATLADWAVRLL